MRTNSPSFLAFLPAVVTFAAFTGCGGSTPATTTTSDAGGTDTNVDTAVAGTVRDHGRVIEYANGNPIADITLSDLTLSAKTGADGTFALNVRKNTPITMLVTGATYPKTYLGEALFSVDHDHEDIPIPGLALFHVAQNSLDGYDRAKGIVYVLLNATGSCKSVEGATIELKSPADGKLIYFANKFPDVMLTSVKATEGHIPVAAVYNVPPGHALIDLAITHPTCKQIPFPAVVAGTTYTGKVTVEGGDSNSVGHYFMQ